MAISGSDESSTAGANTRHHWYANQPAPYQGLLSRVPGPLPQFPYGLSRTMYWTILSVTHNREWPADPFSIPRASTTLEPSPQLPHAKVESLIDRPSVVLTWTVARLTDFYEKKRTNLDQEFDDHSDELSRQYSDDHSESYLCNDCGGFPCDCSDGNTNSHAKDDSEDASSFCPSDYTDGDEYTDEYFDRCSNESSSGYSDQHFDMHSEADSTIFELTF